MPPPLGKFPSSRVGKRQVICFVAPATLDLVKASAQAKGETLQQALARAVNGEIARIGGSALLTCVRQRRFVRIQKAAQAREAEETPGTRKGRKAISGWFDILEVKAVSDFAIEIGTTIQALAQAGIERISEREKRTAASKNPLTEADAQA